MPVSLLRSLALLALTSIPALAQDTGGAIEQPENPLRVGTDEVFLELAPFVQFDGGWASSSPDDLVGSADRRNGEIPRGRLYMDFGYYDLGGRLTLDFANLEDVPVTYAYLNYAVTDALTVQAGQQDVTFSLQELTGSRAAAFAENGQNATLQIPDAVGLAALYGGDAFSLSAGVYGSDINRQPFDDGASVAARGTLAPYLEGEDAVHLGLALAGTFDPQETVSFSGNAGTSLVSASTVSTRDFEAPGSRIAANLELAATIGRFTLQSEYTLTRVEDRNAGNAFLHGGYLGALVFLTPDHRIYEAKSGTFEQVKPARSVLDGGAGAVELGARLDYLNLSDRDADGGTEVAVTGIVNWYPIDELRFTAQHVYTRVTQGSDRGDEINSTLLRAAIIY